MNSTLRLTMLAVVLIYFITIFYLLKRKRLALKYTLLWLFSGFLMFLVILFPGVLRTIFHQLGIIELTNGLFALVIFCMIIIMVSITSIVSKMNEQIRQLSQQCAMYEKRVRDLERDNRMELEKNDK